MEKITVYTDGATIGNGSKDSKCGWACKLMYHGHSKIKSGSDMGKTNNYMEMTAVLNALKSITDKNKPVELYSDSQYVINTLNGKFSIGANVELWAEIMKERSKFKDIKFIWLRGHNGNEHNEQVDRAAYKEATNV